MLSSATYPLSTSVMRAVVVSKFGDPDVLKVKHDVPIPKAGPGEVLLKVGAIGVNPVDTYVRSGNFTRLPTLPYVPGIDVAGTVVSIGGDVEKCKVGDQVASFTNIKSGGYAEYCVVSVDFILPLPKNYDLMKGAAVGTPYFTAYKALFLLGEAKPNQTVLVHGASGGVGIAACQLATSIGMTVLGTAGSAKGIEVVSEQGAKYVFNHKEEGYTAKIMQATEGRGPDIILEMLSNVNLNKDLEMLAPKGRVMIIGCRGAIEINPRLTMVKETRIQGVTVLDSTKEEFSVMARAIEAGLSKGWLDPCVGVSLPLDSVQQAHHDIIFNEGCHGKMVLVI